MLYFIGRFLFRMLFATAFRWKIEGREHVPPRGAVLLVANHASYLDPPLVGAATIRPVYFMAKAELYRNKLFAQILTRVNTFPVARGRPDRKAIRRALELLHNGHVLALFPEGTRGEGEHLLPMKRGAGLMAYRTDATVVPVGLLGTDRLRRDWFRLSQIRVRFGPPIPMADLRELPEREAIQRFGERMAERIRRLLDEMRTPG